MLKLSIYATVIIFLAAGIIFMFFVDVDSSSITARKDSNKNNDINSYIIKDDINIRTLADKITAECSRENKACAVLKLYEYTKNGFIITETDGAAPAPVKTFRKREGSYLDVTVLFSSFLLNSGIPAFIKRDNDRYFSYACGITNTDMYNEIIKDIRGAPLAAKNVTLKKNQIWALDLSRNGTESMIIDVIAFSSEPVDAVLFPNKTEMNAYLKGLYGRYDKDCAVFNSSDIKFSCAAAPDSILIFKSLEDENNFRGSIYRGGFLIGDIKSETSKQGNNCIKIDIKLKGPFQYPGVI